MPGESSSVYIFIIPPCPGVGLDVLALFVLRFLIPAAESLLNTLGEGALPLSDLCRKQV